MARPPRAAQSLTGRVLTAVFLLLILGGLLVAVWTWYNGRLAARQSYDRLLIGAANDIAESIGVQNGRVMVDLPVSAFELLAQAPDERIFYAVYGPDGALITGLDGLDTPGSTPRGVLRQFFDGNLQGDPARFVTVVRRFAERDLSGNVLVTVGQTTGARRTMVVDLMLDALIPLAFAGLFLMAVAFVVMRSVVRPLETLTADLARRDPYDLTPIQVSGLPRELQVVLDSMNRFMNRLDKQISGMRTLISDTAHQLRTPVAAIRAQAESMADSPTETDRARLQDRLLARTRALGELLDQLLSRALVVHRADSVSPLPFDLRDIALDLVEKRDHELLAPGVEVRLEIGEDPVTVTADPFSVEQAARNLLVNALRHGAPPVTVGTEARRPEAALWVQDAGPGPAASVIASLGARFERSAASPEGSIGLGLSIVTAVAEAFGGRVEMAPSDTGFRVSLVLPASPAPREDT
ncbi:MAG: sensor histidine kinase [Rhodobacteraceae bacterium]|nr:sensor histidine kinase [Paracoccaceae bacterium]